MRTSISFRNTVSAFIIILFISSTVFGGNPVRAKNGMVVSADKLATEIGVRILQKGGNAVDAAVAVGFALAVTYPTAGNIGGGGFMVIHLKDGKNTTIDFRETAPLASFEKMYLDSSGDFDPKLSQTGWKSSGIPGTVAGLCYALEKYGTLTLSDVIQPAIDLANNGFKLSHSTANSISSYIDRFNEYASSKKIFTENGLPLKEGTLFIQSDLAHTLELIRDNGTDEFYKGSIAKKIVEQSELNEGIFSLEDLKEYKPVERKPLIGEYRGYEIVSMGPPSSGGICLIEALNILEHYNFKKEDWGSSEYLFTLIETMKRIYADRAKFMGDSDFYPVPVDELISKSYGDYLRGKIKETATPSEEINAALPVRNESKETTHFSVADKFGNAVSTTYTLNGGYGNKIVVEGLGFLLNNEMDDFSSKPGSPNMYGLIGSKANSIQPKKRMLSSMTPTIVLKDGKPLMIIGTPGGSTIITAVLQTILNVLDFGMNINDAITAPKIHHQWLPDEFDYEPFGLSEDVKNNLIKRGEIAGSRTLLGRMEGIIIDSENSVFFGASDPRGHGKAEGY